MNTIVDYAKGGVEQAGEVAVAQRVPVNTYESIVNGLLGRKRQKLPLVDSSGGDLISPEVVSIPVRDKHGMGLLRILSEAQASGYLYFNDKMTHGMLSPNYDASGQNKKNSIRFQSVLGGFTIRKGVWLPEASNALYLAGATGLEAKGVGSHDVPVSKDPEHKLTIYGAVSKGDINIAKTHAQHGVRKSGDSVAHSLSDGSLGDVFSPKSIEGFNGFGKPIELTGNEVPNATFYIPVGYLENPEQSFGAYITNSGLTPEQIVSGAAIRAVSSRGKSVSEFTKAMEG